MSIDKDFEDFFRERLEGLEETPPANGWEKIRADIKPWYKKVNWLAAAALLCLLSALVYIGVQVPGLLQEQRAMQPEQPASGLAASEPASARTESPTQVPVPESAPAISATRPVAGELPQKESIQSTFSAENPTVSDKRAYTGAVSEEPLLAVTTTTGKEKKNKKAAAAQLQRGLAATSLIAGTARQHTPKTALLGETKQAGKENTSKQISETGKQPVQQPSETMTARTATPENAASATPAENEAVISATAGVYQSAEIALLALRPFEDEADLEIPEKLPLLPIADGTAAKTDVKPLALWSLSGFVSPRSTFSSYSANRSDNKMIRDVNKTNNTLSDVLSYETGLTLHRAVSDRLTLDGGIVYTALKDEVHYQITTGEIKSVAVKTFSQNAAGIEVDYNFYSESIRTRYQYAGLKLGTSYTLAQKDKTRFYASGGGILQVLVGNRTEVLRNGLPLHSSLTGLSSEPMRKLNGQLYGSFGFSRQFDKQWHVFAEPGFGYFVGSAIRKTEVLQLKPLTLGFNFGLRYEL